MLLRVVKTGPGCTYRPGQFIHIDEAIAKTWIMRGFAAPAEQSEVPSEVPASTHMLPPRFLCGCGFVAKSAAGLKSHQRKCE